jgi:hypothetical protein
MAIFGKQTVTAVPATTATHVYTKTGTAQNVTLVNNGSVTVYVGGASSSLTTNGVQVAAGSQLTLQGPDADLWVYAASATSVTTGLATLAAID